MEARARVTETVLAGGELTEVTCSLGHDVVIKLEDDPSGGLAINGDVELDVESASVSFYGPDLRTEEGESAA